MSQNSNTRDPDMPSGSYLAVFWKKTKERARFLSPSRPRKKHNPAHSISTATLDTIARRSQHALTNADGDSSAGENAQHLPNINASPTITSTLRAEPAATKSEIAVNTNITRADSPSIQAPTQPGTPDICFPQDDSLSLPSSKAEPSASNSNKTITPDVDNHTSQEQCANTAKPTCWEEARSKLTVKQRKILSAFNIENTQTLETEIKTLRSLKDGCTDVLGSDEGRKPIITRARVHNILKKMEKYAKIGDLATQGSPEVVSLVWSGVRFCLQVALNDMQSFEGVSSALDDIAAIMGSCRIYERIYSSGELESAKAVMTQLPRLYSSCLIFMVEAIDFFNTKAPGRVAGGITNPFQTRFEPLIGDINTGKAELGRRARVASDELQDNQKKELRQLSELLGEFQIDILGVKSGVDTLLTHADESKRRDALNWLSTVDFGAHHEKSQTQRFDGTGKWLFENPTFESWIESEYSSVMWLSGKAGSGKTILSSLIIDALRVTYKSIPTIYFYCNYGESTRRETSPIINSLLRQLSTKNDYLDPKILEASKNQISLSLQNSEYCLGEALSRSSKTFIVLDALDECSEEDRGSLVKLLIRQLMVEGRHVKIFLTSRPENDLCRLFENNPNYHIDANDTLKDIKPFVKERIETAIRDRKLLNGKVTKQLKDDLISTISSEANGMFLWAKLQLDHICKQGNENEARAQLRKLPRGLNNTYDRMWTKITGEDSDDSESKWALKTLKLVLHAKRPLYPKEILDATAIEPGVVGFDPTQKAASLDYLIGVCGNFVALDEQTNLLRFVHYSAQEYLKQKPDFDDAEDFITEICFTILGDIGEKTERTRIFSYVFDYWVEHARKWKVINSQRENLIRGFLFGPRNITALMKENRIEAYYPSTSPYRGTPYQVMSHYNLPVILRYFLKQEPNSESEKPSLLLLAASCGSAEVVKYLLDAGTYVNFQGGEYGSALQAAAVRGSEEVVQLLLDAGADVNLQGGEYGSALQAAAYDGSEKVVQLLLDAGADVNLQGGEHGSALQAAAVRDSEEVVQLLLDAGADVSLRGGEYGSALQAAAYDGSEKVVQLLLDAGADVNLQGGEHGSALQAAASNLNYSGKVVQLLLDAGADVNLQGGKYGSALQAATQRHFYTGIQLLRARGATA